MAFALPSVPLANGVKMLKCGSCGRTHRPLYTEGKGSAEVLIVFGQPTKRQSEARSWFSGDSSLLRTFDNQGFNVREECWVTGVFVCCGSGVNYEYCIVNLEKTIKELQPRLIVTSGEIATGAVLRLYNPKHFGLAYTSNLYVGRFIPLQRKDDMFGCWLAPVMADKDIHSYDNPVMQEVAKNWMSKHINYAMDNYVLRPKPLEHPEPELLYSTSDIIGALKQASIAPYAAFDYETNCLQPEQEKARVLTASVAFGDSDQIYRGVAFPLSSEVVKVAWIDFLRSKSKKIIANVKFEERWSSVIFKQPINNFYWDVCVGGRVLDCYSGVAGLKFLTFEHFGVIGYDDDVAPFIDNDDTQYNRLMKMDVNKLLLYNCLDSIYTYAVAARQHDQFGLIF